MKRKILIFIFVFCSFLSFGQMRSVYHVTDNSTQFGRALAVGQIILVQNTGETWQVTTQTAQSTSTVTSLVAGTNLIEQISGEESAYDHLSNILTEGTGITLTKDDVNNQITVTAAAPSYDAPRVTNFTIDIPSRVDLNTNLNVSKTITFDLIHSANISGDLTLDVSGGDNISVTSPFVDGTNTKAVALTGIVTSSATDVVFKITGVDTQSTLFESNTQTVDVRDLNEHEYLYDGVRATNDFATVDVSLLDRHEVGSVSGQVILVSTGAVTDGQYFGILVRSTHTITITDTTLQQDVTSIFSHSQNVRQINGQNFDYYVIGPLNADADGESYNITIN